MMPFVQNPSVTICPTSSLDQIKPPPRSKQTPLSISAQRAIRRSHDASLSHLDDVRLCPPPPLRSKRQNALHDLSWRNKKDTRPTNVFEMASMKPQAQPKAAKVPLYRVSLSFSKISLPHVELYKCTQEREAGKNGLNPLNQASCQMLKPT